ncbi:MAG: alpha-amylase family glycosyl hydrolase [Pyrinomonadaceae bacterium]|nr:alpha-amylase family glycosyl hydrolase [Pyrinomonadaceae bacterium]
MLFAVISAAAAPRVEKVEPPNWWAGHTLNPVRVMVRGEGFKGASVVSRDPQLAVSNIRINDRGDHIFFDVAISPATRPGSYKFDLTTLAGAVTVNFEVKPQLTPRSREQEITSDDIIYLIMTDRFADGDTSNNKDVDRANPRGWHGGDIKGVISRLDYLKDLGVTAIWLTPWYDNPDEPNRCDQPWCPYTNYHGYHAIDYYAVENHFGTMADVQTLVREAEKRGMKVIQDQVANHVGVQHEWVKRPPLANWFSPFKQNTFNDSAVFSPNASQAERDVLLRGWFNEFLPDLNQDEPEVSRYLIQNALWWIGMTGIDGIRQDTIQYMPRTFIRDWSTAIQKQYPDYYLVGEVLEMDSAHLSFFQGGKAGWDGIDTKLPSVFDFNLWDASRDVFTGKKPASALRDVLKYDGLYSNINRVTTLSGNHDLDRFMSTPGATPEGAMMHMAFMMSVRGIPQMYYGDELGLTGGHDPENRNDFPGGFPSDTRSAFAYEGRTDAEQRVFEWTRDWIKLRRENRALSEGRTTDVFYDAGVYVFERTAGKESVIVGFNVSDKPRKITEAGGLEIPPRSAVYKVRK